MNAVNLSPFSHHSNQFKFFWSLLLFTRFSSEGSLFVAIFRGAEITFYRYSNLVI